jgi:hypothetical protein
MDKIRLGLWISKENNDRLEDVIYKSRKGDKPISKTGLVNRAIEKYLKE